MNKIDIDKQIREVEEELKTLPLGNLTVKTIGGKDYYYLRVIKNNKRTEKYVPFDKVDELSNLIERRKGLEKQLKELKRTVVKKDYDIHQYLTYVRTGEELNKLSSGVKRYKKRECYKELFNYVFGKQVDKVFILYGLRRTGKTTLIRQVLLDMNDEQLNKTAFIQIKSSDTLNGINNDLKYLESKGYKYIFIDEVTLIKDFIEGAALFSDIYVSSGMKIVLSGTDSLGFIFSKDEQLYDRSILLHTTFIPYREFENVLGIKGIDEYIKYGGTMSLSGTDYNNSLFSNSDSVNEYVDSAIAHNIQHSLKYYQDGGHFRILYELYENSKLTSVINRVVEDMNHRFTKEVLTRTFKSSDLSLSGRNLLHDRSNPIDLKDNLDIEKVTRVYKNILEILDINEQSISINDEHAYQIKEYLSLLDLVMNVDLRYLPNVNSKNKVVIISQPGIRYAQADALIKSIILDEKFNSLSLIERNQIVNRILSEIKGRMMEDIVLLESKISNKNKEVFKLQFAVGEFDMVIHDPINLNCEIYEVKYSDKIVDNQYRHLVDEDKCKATIHRYGDIVSKNVIYRGITTKHNDINYINVEEYLKSLG